MGKRLVTCMFELMELLEGENRAKKLREAEKKRKRQEKLAREAELLKLPRDDAGGSAARRKDGKVSKQGSKQNVNRDTDATILTRKSTDNALSKSIHAETLTCPDEPPLRCLNDMIDQLMAEESKRGQMEKVEEEELGFKADANDIDADDKSEGSDGELSGKERLDLVADLIGAIDAPKKRGQTNQVSFKSQKVPKKVKPTSKSKQKPAEQEKLPSKAGAPAPRKEDRRELARSPIPAPASNNRSPYRPTEAL